MVKGYHLLLCRENCLAYEFSTRILDVQKGKIEYEKIIIGILAGIVCGLFGTGGGLVLVPAFIYMLEIEPKKREQLH